jgi:alkylation response protein AidB-like acyl-CoA dehydrogenase
LFEGHVNALELVLRYGDHERVELVAEEARAGKLFGVWNTDDADGLRLIHRHGRSWLEGRKILASGAGHIERPLVTATDENGRRLMGLPKVDAPDRADLSRWTAQGMRASATGAVDFTGVEIAPLEIMGFAAVEGRNGGTAGKRSNHKLYCVFIKMAGSPANRRHCKEHRGSNPLSFCLDARAAHLRAKPLA